MPGRARRRERGSVSGRTLKVYTPEQGNPVSVGSKRVSALGEKHHQNIFSNFTKKEKKNVAI